MPDFGKFSVRIKKRHEIFWNDINAELVRNTPMTEDDPIEKWKDDVYWQRKLSNKFNAREFAKKHGCDVAKLLWKGADAEHIDFSALPPQYVIRPTIGHSCNNVYIMTNGVNLFDHKYYTPAGIKDALKIETLKNPAQEFLIEEFLMNDSGAYEILKDYKFFCFNGKIATICVIRRLSPQSGYNTFYDEHWNKMKMVNKTFGDGEDHPKPECFDDMVEQAKRLSKAYGIFVRIDFYSTYRGAVFGEFTPTPGMGNNYSRFGEELLSKYWENYCYGLV